MPSLPGPEFLDPLISPGATPLLAFEMVTFEQGVQSMIETF